MLVLVNTVILADDDYVVNARFYHTMTFSEGNVRLAVLGKRVAVTFRRRRDARRTSDARLIYYYKRRRNRRRCISTGWRAILIGNQSRTSSGTQIASSSSSGSPALATKEEPNNPHTLAFPAPGSSGVLPDTQPLSNIAEVPAYLQPLANEATAQQTAQWLQNNRFGSYLRVFASFSGADILRLSRDDLIQICGLPDGIRLFNALHSKAIAPRLTLYLCVEQNTVYHALYLDTLTCSEMMSKLAQLMGITSDQIHDIYIQGPNAIHVLITDDVVRNIKDESMFAIEILQDQSGERYRLLLKPASR